MIDEKGSLGRAAHAFGLTLDELEKLIGALGVEAEVEKVRERYTREALAPDNLSLRLDLLFRGRVPGGPGDRAEVPAGADQAAGRADRRSEGRRHHRGHPGGPAFATTRAPRREPAASAGETRAARALAQGQEVTAVPIYEYKCQKCGKELEVMHKVNDPAPAECPQCHESGTLEKLVSRTSFQLKGGGWYSDLYGSAKKSDVVEHRRLAPPRPPATTAAPAATTTTPTAAPAAPAVLGLGHREAAAEAAAGAAARAVPPREGARCVAGLARVERLRHRAGGDSTHPGAPISSARSTAISASCASRCT